MTKTKITSGTNNMKFPKVTNSETAKWTFFTAAGLLGICCIDYYVRQKIKSNTDEKKQQADEGREIRMEATKTACTMLKTAANMMPELNKLKQEVGDLKVQFTGGSSDSNEKANDETDNMVESPIWEGSDYEGAIVECAEGEIVPGLIVKDSTNCLVAGAAVGKSILMQQIAYSVQAGERIDFLSDREYDPTKMQVVFYRLEEYPTEYYNKYGKGDFLRKSGILWKTNSDFPVCNLNALTNDIEQYAKQATIDTLVCIDPITKLSDYNHEKFIKAVESIQKIARQKNVSLTIFFSAHLDEIPAWRVLKPGDIKGGDKLFQQCGTVFALRNEREGGSSRFLQVIKAPKGQATPEKVLVCDIVKTTIDDENWFTHLTYKCEKKETEALPIKPKAERTSEERKAAKDQSMREILQGYVKDGYTALQIAKKLKVSRKTVYNRCEKFEIPIKKEEAE